VPLAATLTGGHRNDVTQLLPIVDGIGAIAGKRGRPRRRPDRLIADRGYDHDKYRRELWRRGVKPVIARRCTEHGSGLGRVRWVVERTFAWLHNSAGSASAGNATRPALCVPEPRMLAHLLATHATVTQQRGPLLGCMRMQERRESRSRVGGRLVLVPSGRLPKII
jgi:transposase